MTRTTWRELSEARRQAMSRDERAEYDRAYAEARLAADVDRQAHPGRHGRRPD
jgi:hypothetical protein